MLPYFSWTLLGRESPFCHKVVYNVVNGCSLWQKSMHHERENTMPFSSIPLVKGGPFLHCWLLWEQLCRTDYQTLFKPGIFLQKLAWKSTCFQHSIYWSNPWLPVSHNFWVLKNQHSSIVCFVNGYPLDRDIVCW